MGVNVTFGDEVPLIEFLEPSRFLGLFDLADIEGPQIHAVEFSAKVEKEDAVLAVVEVIGGGQMFIKEEVPLHQGRGAERKAPHAEARKIGKGSLPFFFGPGVDGIPVFPNRVETDGLGRGKPLIGRLDGCEITRSEDAVVVDEEADVALSVLNQEVASHRNPSFQGGNDFDPMAVELEGIFGIFAALIQEDGFALNAQKDSQFLYLVEALVEARDEDLNQHPFPRL
jgi:hypothetical protein